MSNILEIASKVSTPLALGGLTVGVAFLIIRQLLTLQIFPQLTKGLSADVIKLIIDRLFKLALVAMVLGFLGFMANFIPVSAHDNGDSGTHAQEQEIAQKALDAFYKRDFKVLYDTFTPLLRQSIAFERFVAEHEVERSQFTSIPTYRRFEKQSVAAGYLLITFLAEFDGTSTFREAVQFARQSDQWQLWRFDINPAAWPQLATSKVARETKPSEILEELSQLSDDERATRIRGSYESFFTPATGWHVVVDDSSERVDRQTCNVISHERGGSTNVFLRAAMGSCGLKTGAELIVLGRIKNVSGEQIVVEDVRFSPR